MGKGKHGRSRSSSCSSSSSSSSSSSDGSKKHYGGGKLKKSHQTHGMPEVHGIPIRGMPEMPVPGGSGIMPQPQSPQNSSYYQQGGQQGQRQGQGSDRGVGTALLAAGAGYYFGSHHNSSSGSHSPQPQPQPQSQQYPQQQQSNHMAVGWTHAQHQENGNWGANVSSPPPYQQQPPSGQGQGQNGGSGMRYKLYTNEPFPNFVTEQNAACRDADGSPVFFGSAHMGQNSVHPCKVAPALGTSLVRVPYGGGEREHQGQYDLLPFTNEMELVPTYGGHIPAGRRPVIGGQETFNGQNVLLYHAVAVWDGVRVPGKAAAHLNGCNVAFGCSEVYCREYDLLCWRN